MTFGASEGTASFMAKNVAQGASEGFAITHAQSTSKVSVYTGRINER